MDTKPCALCGGPVVRQPGWHPGYFARKLYCSRSCASQSHRSKPPKFCIRCGGRVPARLSETRLYCGMACYSAARLERPHDPQKFGRHVAITRYEARPCESCGTESRPEYRGPASTIHRHHRDGNQMNNEPENIAFLCRPCHTEAHRVMAAAGIGRKSGGARPRIAALFRDRAIVRFREAVVLRSAGRSDPEIAAEMGVHPETVSRWFRKYTEEP